MTRAELAAAVQARRVERGLLGAEQRWHAAPRLLVLHPADWEDVLLDPTPGHVTEITQPRPGAFAWRGIELGEDPRLARGDVVLHWP